MNHDLIKELCDTPGVPGCEDAISSIVLREIEDLCVAYLKDPMGNLIFQVNDTIPEAPTILIDAHMDEVGFIVSHIEDNGMLRVIPLGGIDPKLFYGQRLTIWGKEKVESTVAAIPPHISDKNSSGSIPVDDCLIDTGISPNKIKKIIRIGLYVMLETIKKINVKRLKCNFFASASVQEEMGLRGARIINSQVNPDFSIALEGTVSNDLPGIPLHKKLAQLGDGPEIRISDKYLIADRGFNEYIQKIAKNKKINCQLTAKNAGGTNSTAFQVTGKGSKATVLSVPVRYLHSPSSVCLLKDVDSTIKLLTSSILDMHKFKND
jgi:putative aminopeptidase FrvX